MTEDKPDLGEKALGKVVELGINSQLDEAEKLDVVIRTDPAKLVQGKVDSVAISGAGLVMKQDLRMESVEVSTSSVEINPISLAFGKVELTQSTDAQAQLVLTETDLNRALASEYLHSRMQNVEIHIDGESRAIDIQQVQVSLLDDNALSIKADLFQQNSSEKISFSAIAKPSLQDNGQRIALEILSAEGQGLSLVLAKALFERIMELLEFRNFDIQGVTFWLKELHVRKGKLVIQATSVIDQFPAL
ncbi:MAG: DUF2993 domain-containing protein [Drouetiella hepatica Uher 2000/2452]|jgi:hypothetical protein|uniref:DUF2993 domain-containing protein n=1 Tax=Drouetiella hepatica Uher 2000/2452 TaxID=904376 RepID=A0A951QB74_9CYAN|nr:DUF2993 domain-containing protein [Drouetiella hepatica Uher 2000/2452]